MLLRQGVHRSSTFIFTCLLLSRMCDPATGLVIYLSWVECVHYISDSNQETSVLQIQCNIYSTETLACFC